MAQVGAGATGWATTDQGWRTLSDVLAQPPRPSATPRTLPPIPKRSDWAAPLETGVALAQVAAARSRIPVAEVRGPAKIKKTLAEPGWSSSERRLWWMAGGLMLLAAAVLSTLALLTFGGISLSAMVGPAHHEEPATRAEEPAVHHEEPAVHHARPAAAPIVVAAAAPVAVASAAPVEKTEPAAPAIVSHAAAHHTRRHHRHRRHHH